MVAMVPSELTFLEVKKEFIFADAVEFNEAMLSEAPKGFDSIDMVLAAGKFVFMVMDTMHPLKKLGERIARPDFE